jgi:hypothetical protein
MAESAQMRTDGPAGEPRLDFGVQVDQAVDRLGGPLPPIAAESRHGKPPHEASTAVQPTRFRETAGAHIFLCEMSPRQIDTRWSYDAEIEYESVPVELHVQQLEILSSTPLQVAERKRPTHLGTCSFFAG